MISILIMGVLPALLVLGLLLWGIKNPVAWMLVSVLLITAGVACAVYGVTDVIALGKDRDSHQVSVAAIFVGAGAGAMVGGAVLLLLSLLRRRKSPEGIAKS